MRFQSILWWICWLFVVAGLQWTGSAAPRPNIILIMTDDQGWGEAGFREHPVLRTPNLDAMAASGLRFDRFYAAAPVCSPTRASVLTGRAPFRTGVVLHGYALRRQERTLAQALRAAGYRTAHFGKWHLDGLRGPGVPILANDPHHPGHFGFDHWVSSTNYFDFDPILGESTGFHRTTGESSAVVFEEALRFITTKARTEHPFFVVIWASAPHSPFAATEADRRDFSDLGLESQHHYGELVAFDRHLGILRGALREAGLAENTLIWFCSDNGGLPDIEHGTTGGLRGHKGSLWEGGLRVPAVVEWPGRLSPGVTAFPASTCDIFPTIADLLELPEAAMLDPVDGISLRDALFAGAVERSRPMAFLYRNQSAFIEGHHKLLLLGDPGEPGRLYNLEDDPGETRDLANREPDRVRLLTEQLARWREGVDASFAGKDYPEGRVIPGDPEPVFWWDKTDYAPWLKTWRDRADYRQHLRQAFPSNP